MVDGWRRVTVEDVSMPVLKADPMNMPAADHDLAARVVRRYLAEVRVERMAREVQRRSEGLVTVREDDEEDDGDRRAGAGPSEDHPQ